MAISTFTLRRCELAWRRNHPMYGLPYSWRSWLTDDGSLTKRLIEASNGDFRVEVVKQRLSRPTPFEQKALKLPSHRLALVREVILYGCDQPWVYARSVLPLTTLTGRLRRLHKLDNSPLGALLFSDPTMSREPMEISCLNIANRYLPQSVLAKTGHIETPLWGRRSVFRLDNKPLLVAEIFLPDFISYNRRSSHKLDV